MKRSLIGWIVGFLLLLTVGFFAFKWATRLTPKSLRLADGTEAFFLSDTTVVPATGYPKPKELHVNGDAFIRSLVSGEPLIVRSRLLNLTVTGDAAFHITAFAKQTGEQVEVLRGQVVAHKAYESRFQEPDTLTTGQMVMINRTIDLMEKETCDVVALRKWSEEIVAAVARAR